MLAIMQSTVKRHMSDILQAVRSNRIKDAKRLVDAWLAKSHSFSCLSSPDHIRGLENVVMAASALQDTSMLEYLLQKGASVNFCSETQPLVKGTRVTPLHIAVSNGLHDCMEVLLKNSASVNCLDSQGRTSLHIAAWKADCIALRMLLHRGADVLAINRTGETALQIASRYGHVELVRILLEYGAEVFQEGQRGPSPLHIAASEGHVPLIDMFAQNIDINILVECTPRIHQAALHLAAKNGLFETVRFIVERYFADVNVLDSQHRNAMHYVVCKKYSSKCVRRKEDYNYVCEFLLVRNIHVNQQDDAGMTSLHMAAHNQYNKIAELLFLHGANANLKDKLGRTAWDYIANYDVHTQQVFSKFAPKPRPLLPSPLAGSADKDSNKRNYTSNALRGEKVRCDKMTVCSEAESEGSSVSEIVEEDSETEANKCNSKHVEAPPPKTIVKEKIILNDGRVIYKTMPRLNSD